MTQFPEDLETIIFRLTDEGWTERHYVFFDGMYEVNMVKGNKRIRIEYEE